MEPVEAQRPAAEGSAPPKGPGAHNLGKPPAPASQVNGTGAPAPRPVGPPQRAAPEPRPAVPRQPTSPATQSASAAPQSDVQSSMKREAVANDVSSIEAEYIEESDDEDDTLEDHFRAKVERKQLDLEELGKIPLANMKWRIAGKLFQHKKAASKYTLSFRRTADAMEGNDNGDAAAPRHSIVWEYQSEEGQVVDAKSFQFDVLNDVIKMRYYVKSEPMCIALWSRIRVPQSLLPRDMRDDWLQKQQKREDRDEEEPEWPVVAVLPASHRALAQQMVYAFKHMYESDMEDIMGFTLTESTSITGNDDVQGEYSLASSSQKKAHSKILMGHDVRDPKKMLSGVIYPLIRPCLHLLLPCHLPCPRWSAPASASARCRWM